jgi:prepilin-type N-terminal cleavage/methylation domain-containing protein
MKSIVKQSSRKKAFTIIELLTVMSIIVILIGVLVPALNNVRRYAKKVKQLAQFNAINAATELFSNENDGYPPSSALDGAGQPYCGAMKLCEAMMGRDLLGFHPDSVFRADGLDRNGTRPVYLPTPDNVKARMGTLLQFENANAYRIGADIYGLGNTGSFNENLFVLCDVYTRDMRTGQKTGMPILYYKADTSNYLHDPNQPMTASDSGGNTYNYWDNQALVGLGKPWEKTGVSSSAPPSLANPARFYRNTRNNQITTVRRPYRTDSYILISAGFDGEYGTADDICNFDWKYRE